MYIILCYYIATAPIGLCIEKTNYAYKPRVRIKMGLAIIIIKDKQYYCLFNI